MGVAAYNRGSAVVARHIREQYDKGRDGELFADLTQLSVSLPDNGFGRLGQGTGIRYDGKVWWLMNRLDDGWGEYGIWYRSLRDIAKAWRIWFVGWSYDQHGEYIAVESVP